MRVEAGSIRPFKKSAWLVQGKCCLKNLEHFWLDFLLVLSIKA